MKYALKRNILKNSIKKYWTSCLYSTHALIATIKVEFSYSKTTRYWSDEYWKKYWYWQYSIPVFNTSIQYQYSIHFWASIDIEFRGFQGRFYMSLVLQLKLYIIWARLPSFELIKSTLLFFNLQKTFDTIPCKFSKGHLSF